MQKQLKELKQKKKELEELLREWDRCDFEDLDLQRQLRYTSARYELYIIKRKIKELQEVKR